MTGDVEPVVAVAATPRAWGQALHRHLADHGGARLRATVLHPDDAVAEDYDVLIADDATSFLTHRLVTELARDGRAVLGVFDPDDPSGKERLADLGVADVVECHAEPPEVVARVVALVATDATGRAATRDAELPVPPRHRAGGGRVIAVTGAAGGSGASEAAATLADVAGTAPRPAVLVDANDRWPTLAQRLGCGLYPNVVAAAEAHARGHDRLREQLQRPTGARTALLAGASREHAEVGGEQLVGLVDTLAAAFGLAVADLTGGPEALTGDHGRHGTAGHLLARADRVVTVADASPCGAARLLAWLAAADGLVEPARVHVAFNRSDPEAFRRRELDREMARVARVAGVWHLPADARVGRAAWDGTPVATGPYRRAVATLLAGLASGAAPRRRRGWPRRRVRTGART